MHKAKLLNYPVINYRLLYCYTSFNNSFDNKQDHTAPYWRLYWNDKEGGAVVSETQEYKLGPSKILLISPGTSFVKKSSSVLNHFHIHFTLGKPYDDIRATFISIKSNSFIREQIAYLIEQIRKESVGSVKYQSLIMSICMWAISHMPSEKYPPEIIDYVVYQACGYINQNCGKPISINQVAHEAGMNTNSFIRKFKLIMGMTPKHYVLKTRIDKACTMLHFGSESIEQIAETCGFGERNYFTRIFKKFMNIGPAEYRKAKL